MFFAFFSRCKITNNLSRDKKYFDFLLLLNAKKNAPIVIAQWQVSVRYLINDSVVALVFLLLKRVIYFFAVRCGL